MFYCIVTFNPICGGAAGKGSMEYLDQMIPKFLDIILLNLRYRCLAQDHFTDISASEKGV